MNFPRKKIVILLLILFSFLPLSTFHFLPSIYNPVHADELDELSKQISDLTRSLEMSRAATRPLEFQLSTLTKKLNDIAQRVLAIEQDLVIKRKQIDKGYENLAVQEKKFNKAVRDFYIKSHYNFPFLVLLSQSSATDVTRILAYQKKAADEDKRIITNLAITVADLEQKEATLASEEEKLSGIKEQLAKEAAFLDQEVKGAKAYQSTLSSKIAQLSARQQQILAEKLGSLNLPTSLGGGILSCTDDRKLDPGFAPALAFYTYGIPHRIGMNQYGALGRSQAGQSHEDILRAYFDNFGFETRGNTNIKVQGYGEMPLETYLLGIYEMPESWPLEALKAQVIAARSYALSYTDNGAKEICTTQSCQVYKQPPKSGAWKTAVEQTAGKVMVSSGQVVTAWYASTAGGYTFKSSDVGWSDRAWTKRLRDTTSDVGSFSDLQSKAYDKESPCFYAAQGFRKEYGKSAWLKPTEVADIVNSILLARADSSVKNHLYQPDESNPEGGETWNEDRVRQELKSRGQTPFGSISGVSVSTDFGAGKTNQITLSGDAGSTTFDGSEFKDWFNLRAPANIQIVGPLYNVERR